MATAPEFTTTMVSGEVRGYEGATPYVRWGNYGFIALSALLILVAVFAHRFGVHHRDTEARRKTGTRNGKGE